MAGNVEKRGKDSWRLTVSVGYDANGKRIRHTRTVKATSKREAEKELAKFIAEVEAGSYVKPAKMTLNAFTQDWLTHYAEKQLSPKTLLNYKEALNLRVLPAMGHLKLETIKPFHLLSFMDNLQEEGIKKGGGKLSAATINVYYRLIRSIFRCAVDWGILATNPAKNLKPLKEKSQSGNAYDKEQVVALLEAAHKEGIQRELLIHMAVMTGLRLGELHALEWDHIDLEARTLEVKQMAQYIRGEGVIIKEPKTSSSKRIIHLAETTIGLLKEYRKYWLKLRLKLGDKWKLEKDFLFCSTVGNLISPVYHSSWFGRFLKKHGLPQIRFHDLRHTSATLLIMSNQSIKVISSRLGHSKINTTMDIYGHMLKDADQQAADTLAEIVQIPGNKAKG